MDAFIVMLSLQCIIIGVATYFYLDTIFRSSAIGFKSVWTFALFYAFISAAFLMAILLIGSYWYETLYPPTTEKLILIESVEK